MNLYARQGDLVFQRTETPASGETVHNHVLAGSHGGRHTVAGSAVVEQRGTGWRVTVTTPTEVTHESRHLPITLEPGNYDVWRLRERGGEGDRDVED